MSKIKLSMAMAVLAIVVAGCQSAPRQRVSVAPVDTTPQLTGIQGDWRATEGPLLATFSGTQFKSVNTENNQVVAAGSFKYNSEQNIQLDWIGALSGRASANCKLVSRDLMNCTPSNGSGFQLRRV